MNTGTVVSTGKDELGACMQLATPGPLSLVAAAVAPTRMFRRGSPAHAEHACSGTASEPTGPPSRSQSS